MDEYSRTQEVMLSIKWTSHACILMAIVLPIVGIIEGKRHELPATFAILFLGLTGVSIAKVLANLDRRISALEETGANGE